MGAGRVAIQVRWVGRVQGVGFRRSVQLACHRLAVGGWVQNECDGSVRALLVGDRSAVDAALASIAATPLATILSAASVDTAIPERVPSPFEIRH